MPPLSLFCQNSGILKLPYSSVYPIYDTLTTAFSEIHACISEEGVFMRHKTSGYFLLSALLVSLILGLCILLNLRCPQAVSDDALTQEQLTRGVTLTGWQQTGPGHWRFAFEAPADVPELVLCLSTRSLDAVPEGLEPTDQRGEAFWVRPVPGRTSEITVTSTTVPQMWLMLPDTLWHWRELRSSLQLMALVAFASMGAGILALFCFKPQHELGVFLLYLGVMFGVTFTLGLDLGIVMAKGVVIGVICCVTVLPSMILIFDKPIEKTCHRALLPKFDKLSKFIVNKYWIFHILFLILLVPALYGYTHTDVYYNLDSSLPEDLPSIQANQKLEEEFNMNSTHMILLDSNLDEKSINKVISEIKNVKGVKTVLGLESVVGPMIPQSMIPQDLKSKLDNGEWKLMLVMSEYKVASDEVNTQCDEINTILHKYDSKGMLIGEAPCTKDLIEITDKDFNTVSTVSIGVILLIILFVFKSVSLPIILVCVIEFAIFINMGIPAFTNTTLPFIASIVIGTIQLGSTVDYAILMTTRYKRERSNGLAKKEAVTVALQTSMISIIVSALSFFAATFGVGCYSEIDMISSLCTLMARGAIISMFVVIFLLPAALMLFDKLIIHTTIGFKGITGKQKAAYAGAGNVDPASEQKTADDDFLNEDRPFAKKKSGNFDNYDFDDSYSDDDKYIDVNNDSNGPADRQ